MPTRSRRATVALMIAALGILVETRSLNAQTAEETVLFIWTGMDEKQAGRTITKLSNCRYVITHKAENVETETTVDFSDVTVFRVTDQVRPRVIVQGIDLQARITDPKTRDTKEIKKKVHEWATFAPAERMEKAIAYFRGSFCKGRAF